jgi:SAM-dependent methyltransferase
MMAGMNAKPPPSSPMQLPATWDAVASGYAEDAAPLMVPFAEHALRLLAPASDARLLDVAAGPGTLACLAAPRVRSVLAVDFAPGMLEQLRARAAREGLQIETALMDAQALAVADADFDAATCMFGFMFFPDRARAFRELHRVLRPGGRALIATWAPIERRPFMKVGMDALVEALPDVPAPAKGDLQQLADCEREMSAAGFRDVRAQTFTASVRFESAEAYARMMERSGAPFAALRKKLGEAAWQEAFARLVEGVRRRLAELGPELSGEAILTIGTR